MEISFGPRGIIQIDDARIIYRNFSGEASKYNREGDRNFAVVIPNEDLKDQLVNDTNQFGLGWNIKIKPPRDEDESPFMFMPVKVRFNDRGPNVYLVTNGNQVRLSEDTIETLDHIDIERVDLDIRPYDDEFNGRAFRSAYLHGMRVVQRVTDRFAEEEYPGELPFE